MISGYCQIAARHSRNWDLRPKDFAVSAPRAYVLQHRCEVSHEHGYPVEKPVLRVDDATARQHVVHVAGALRRHQNWIIYRSLAVASVKFLPCHFLHAGGG